LHSWLNSYSMHSAEVFMFLSCFHQYDFSFAIIAKKSTKTMRTIQHQKLLQTNHTLLFPAVNCGTASLWPVRKVNSRSSCRCVSDLVWLEVTLLSNTYIQQNLGNKDIIGQAYLFQRCPYFRVWSALRTVIWDQIISCPNFTGCPHFAGLHFTSFIVLWKIFL
jgi:hypothetical protein